MAAVCTGWELRYFHRVQLSSDLVSLRSCASVICWFLGPGRIRPIVLVGAALYEKLGYSLTGIIPDYALCLMAG